MKPLRMRSYSAAVDDDNRFPTAQSLGVATGSTNTDAAVAVSREASGALIGTNVLDVLKPSAR